MYLLRALCFILLLVGNTSIYAETNYVLKFGFTNERPDEPDYVLQIYGDFIHYLDKKLASHHLHAEIIVAKDLDEMRKKIQRHEINVVSESLFSSLKLEETGMQPLVLAWRKGTRSYQTLFIVRKDSPLTTLADLQGKTIVFESLRSTSAYAVPKAFLQQKNLLIVSAEQEDIPAQAIKYIFAGDEMTQAYQVVLRRVDAAAFGTNDWDETPESVRMQLKIIERTPPILRWLISVHQDVPKQVKTTLQQVLLEMSNETEAEYVLRQSQLTRFETLTPTDNENLDQTKALLQFIQ